MDDDDGTQQTLHCLADWLPPCGVASARVHAGEAVAVAATEDGDLKLFCLFS